MKADVNAQNMSTVCAQFSSKLAHSTWSVYFNAQLFSFLNALLFPMFCPNWDIKRVQWNT